MSAEVPATIHGHTRLSWHRCCCNVTVWATKLDIDGPAMNAGEYTKTESIETDIERYTPAALAKVKELEDRIS